MQSLPVSVSLNDVWPWQEKGTISAILGSKALERLHEVAGKDMDPIKECWQDRLSAISRV